MHHKLVVSIISCLTLFVFTNIQALATPIQNPANGHYYDYVAQGVNWFDANTAASGMTHLGYQGHLATITSSDENAFIYALPGHNGSWTWLGGYQTGSDEPAGGWKWVTGEAFSYMAWSGGEPNNLGGENHLHMWGGSTWNDLSGGSNLGYFVEFEGSGAPLPVPATAMVFGAGLVGLIKAGLRKKIKK